MVYVKLHSYREVFVNQTQCQVELGPYKILDCIGEIAYRIELPAHSKIRNAFHVSQLKKHVKDIAISTNLPYQSEALAEKKKYIDKMTVKRKGVAVTKIFVEGNINSERMQHECSTVT